MLVPQIIRNQFDELREKYPGLYLTYHNKAAWSISGLLYFVASYEGQEIEDKYSIELLVWNNFPNSIPLAKEIGGRIPKTFHHYENDGLCLGAPLAIRQTFRQEPTLLGFTNNCLIPYLYSFSYKSQYGKMPFGELSHGSQGLLEYYQSVFKVDNKKAVVRLLQVLTENNYQTNVKCPCGSRKQIRNCHGNQLQKMMIGESRLEFRKECIELVDVNFEKLLLSRWSYRPYKKALVTSQHFLNLFPHLASSSNKSK